jgi:hypothetical protein
LREEEEDEEPEQHKKRKSAYGILVRKPKRKDH